MAPEVEVLCDPIPNSQRQEGLDFLVNSMFLLPHFWKRVIIYREVDLFSAQLNFAILICEGFYCEKPRVCLHLLHLYVKEEIRIIE